MQLPMYCEASKKIVAGFLSTTTLCAMAAFAADTAPRDVIEVLRADLKANRKAIVAEQMQLTEKESEAFWPIYRDYRAEVEKASDRIAELILEYADLYPNVPEKKASEMLKQYAKTEAELLSVKRKYFKKLEKVLPPSKVFRFAQVDNRYDLATRVGIASSIPLMNAPQAQAPSDQH